MAASTTWGPVTINIQAQFQSKDFFTTSTRTNKSTAGTNIVTIYTSSSTNSLINNAALLKLLAASFSTNFPAGAKLGVDSCMDFVVLDASGSNVVLDVSSVLAVTVYRNILTGTETDTVKRPPGTTTSLLWSITQNQAVAIVYDDSGRGGSNLIYLYGTLAARGSGDLYKKSSTTTTFTGAGYATLGGKGAILHGTMTATAPGVCD
jgi:hypothetical protein